jgi:hypothetical protein
MSVVGDAPAHQEQAMNRFFSSAFLLIALSYGYACGGNSATAGGTQNGGGCSSGGSCAGGVCATSADFPGGYCTTGCSLADATSCPNGSVCIDDASGTPADAGLTAICYQSCTTNADCTRAGYKCLEKAGHMVCRNGA